MKSLVPILLTPKTIIKPIAEACIQLAGFDVYYNDAIVNKMINRAGFTDSEDYQYETCPMSDFVCHIAPHTIAHSGYSLIGDEHVGFSKAADTVWNNLMDNNTGYLKTKGLWDQATNKPKNNVIFLVTGHSRGGAVGDLLSARLNRHLNAGNIQNPVFSYNFAAPGVVQKTLINPIETKIGYENIFCINNAQDEILKYLPLVGTWTRYGRYFEFDVKGDRE
jgi:hypothetical protein